MKQREETIVLGGGCFWCTEAIFQELRGVTSVVPGYAGGITNNPSYYEVADGKTGHAEVIKIEFDPLLIPLADLLEIFWHIHNTTTLNQQGNDIGTQYRSVILYTSDEQKKIIDHSLTHVKEIHMYKDPIVTEVLRLDSFYPAESYHKDYYIQHRDDAYCRVIIAPKLQKLREKYRNMLQKK